MIRAVIENIADLRLLKDLRLFKFNPGEERRNTRGQNRTSVSSGAEHLNLGVRSSFCAGQISIKNLEEFSLYQLGFSNQSS